MALQALEIYPDTVRLVYHHFPTTDSELSMKIAEALEAAGAQGKFWEMHDRIVADVPENMAQLQYVAHEVGLEMIAFDEAIKTGKYTDIILEAISLAKEHDVEDVALFINEMEYSKSPGTLEDLITAIEAELEQETSDRNE